MKNIRNISLVVAAMLLFGFGCGGGSGKKNISGVRTQIRPIEALPNQVAADTITVSQFRYVCDAMARDFIRQPFITRSAQPPVVTIRKIQNKTGIYVDEQIFQETIRAKLMENAGGMVLFRDDVSYNDIIQERVRQSNEEMTVTLTDTVIETKTYDRVRDREYQSGSLSGATINGEQTRNIEEESAMDMSQTASVKSKVAAADYFLRGIVYQVNENDMSNPGSGMSYFQYQFRVVDARNGLIVWEKMLSSKMAGEYMLGQKPAAGGTAGASGQGNVPAGWPTTVVNQNNNPGQTGTNPNQGQTVIPQGQGNAPGNSKNPVKNLLEAVNPIIQQIKK